MLNSCIFLGSVRKVDWQQHKKKKKSKKSKIFCACVEYCESAVRHSPRGHKHKGRQQYAAAFDTIITFYYTIQSQPWRACEVFMAETPCGVSDCQAGRQWSEILETCVNVELNFWLQLIFDLFIYFILFI